MRNAINLTSITFRWTSSNSRQSIFSTTLDGSHDRQENGGKSRSVYLVKIGSKSLSNDSRTFATMKKVIWDQLLATKAKIIQS